jgi:AbrB family looped-hinge helix DNA binding protein
MLTKVSTKGQTVIPTAIREMAQVEAGDELDVGYAAGMIIMRKRRPLTPERVRAMLLAGRKLPRMTAKHEREVERALKQVRRRASR